MNRRTFLHGLTAASTMVVVGSTAFAASFAEDVVSQLARQGFVNIEVETTWLGRVRIVAERADGQREIIMNPRTGEILRDTWQALGNRAVTPIIDDVNAKTASNGDAGGGDTSGSGSSGSDGSGSGSSDGSGSGGDGGQDGGGSDGSEHDGGSGGSDHGGDGKGDDNGDKGGKDN